MRARLLTACLAVFAWSALVSSTASAYLTPEGDPVWTFEVETAEVEGTFAFHPIFRPTLTITRPDGESITAFEDVATISNRPHGQTDEFLAEAYFDRPEFLEFFRLDPQSGGISQARMLIKLQDFDGTAFDGYGGNGAPANPPPLSEFEVATAEIDAVFEHVYSISALPEPSLAPMIVSLLTVAIALRRNRERSVRSSADPRKGRSEREGRRR